MTSLPSANAWKAPAATKLPVRLAVALLKDRKGHINLDIPVSGSLDDPEFGYGRIILKIPLNLLVKAATSPFSLLGALFGGGGEDLGTPSSTTGRVPFQRHVRDAILRTGQVEQDRIFLVKPHSMTPGKTQNVKDSRVDFRLR